MCRQAHYPEVDMATGSRGEGRARARAAGSHAVGPAEFMDYGLETAQRGRAAGRGSDLPARA